MWIKKIYDFPRIFSLLFLVIHEQKRNVAVEKLFVRTLRKIVFFYLETNKKQNRIDEEGKQKKTRSKTEMISCRI